MQLPTLETERVSAHYDPQSKLVRVAYRGVVTAHVTVAVYQWMLDLTQFISVKEVCGAVYDFCAVTDFDLLNLTTAQRESQNINRQLDMSHIAVALIVDSRKQEHLVRMALKVSPQEFRKRIVRSEREAVAFVDEFQARQQSGYEPEQG